MTRRRGQVISMPKDYYALVEGGGLLGFGFYSSFFFIGRLYYIENSKMCSCEMKIMSCGLVVYRITTIPS